MLCRWKLFCWYIHFEIIIIHRDWIDTFYILTFTNAYFFRKLIVVVHWLACKCGAWTPLFSIWFNLTGQTECFLCFLHALQLPCDLCDVQSLLIHFPSHSQFVWEVAAEAAYESDWRGLESFFPDRLQCDVWGDDPQPLDGEEILFVCLFSLASFWAFNDIWYNQKIEAIQSFESYIPSVFGQVTNFVVSILSEMSLYLG